MLRKAARDGRLEVADILLQNGVDVNLRDRVSSSQYYTYLFDITIMIDIVHCTVYIMNKAFSVNNK